jgi:hypothetical protein
MATNSISAIEFKKNFSKVIRQLKTGEQFTIMSENGGEIIGFLTPEVPKKFERKLGILEGKATFTFAEDFKITEEEFLNPK